QRHGAELLFDLGQLLLIVRSGAWREDLVEVAAVLVVADQVGKRLAARCGLLGGDSLMVARAKLGRAGLSFQQRPPAPSVPIRLDRTVREPLVRPVKLFEVDARHSAPSASGRRPSRWRSQERMP